MLIKIGRSHRAQTTVSQEVHFLWLSILRSGKPKPGSNVPELCLLQEQGLGCRQGRRPQPEILSKRAVTGSKMICC